MISSKPRPLPTDRTGMVIVTVIATILALIVTQPLLLQLSSGIYADITGDAVGTVYEYWYWGYALQHGISVFQNHLLGAPYGAGWEFVQFNVLPIALFAPLSALIGANLTYNLGILSSFPATALVTYLLARRIGLSRLASMFVALAFAFAPFHVEKAMGHLAQTHMEVFPGTLLFLVRWRQGGSRLNLAGAGAVAGLTVWTDFYYPFVLGFLILGFMVASLLAPNTRPGGLSRRVGWHATGLAALIGITLLFLPLAVVFAHRPSAGSYTAGITNSVVSLHRTQADVVQYSGHLHEFVVPWHSNPLVPRSVRTWEVAHLHGSNFTENSLFVGYTVVLLALVGLATFRRNKLSVLMGVVLVLEGAVLALPPHPVVLGVRLAAPSALLSHALPFLRVYARFGIITLLGATLLAGLGLMAIEACLQASRLKWLAALPFLLLAIEFNNQPPPHVLNLLPGPAAYRWLAGQPPGAVAEYPVFAGNPGRQEIQTHEYMYYQQVHRHPLVNTDVAASIAYNENSQLEPYYALGVVDRLRARGVRYLLVHRANYQEDGLAAPQAVDGLDLVGTFGDILVFRVRPAP